MNRLGLSLTWLWLGGVLSTSCEQLVSVVPEVSATTKSLVLMIEEKGSTRAFALNVTERLLEPLSSATTVNVFALEYERTLDEVGIPSGRLDLLPAHDPSGAPFPMPVRSTESRVQEGSFLGWTETSPPSWLSTTWFKVPSLSVCLNAGGCFVSAGKEAARCVASCPRAEVQAPADPSEPDLELFPEHWLRFSEPIPYRSPWPIPSTDCNANQMRTPARPDCAPVSPCQDPFERRFGDADVIYVDADADEPGPGRVDAPAATINPAAGDTFVLRPGTYTVPSTVSALRLVGSCSHQVMVSLNEPRVVGSLELERVQLQSPAIVEGTLRFNEVHAKGSIVLEANGRFDGERSLLASSLVVGLTSSAQLKDSSVRNGIIASGEISVEDSALYAQGIPAFWIRGETSRGALLRSYLRVNSGHSVVRNGGTLVAEGVVLDGNWLGQGYADEWSHVGSTVSGAVIVRSNALGGLFRKGHYEDIIVMHDSEDKTQSVQGVVVIGQQEGEAKFRRVQIYGGNPPAFRVDERPQAPFSVDDLIVEGLRSEGFNSSAVQLNDTGPATLRRVRVDAAPHGSVAVLRGKHWVRFEDLTIRSDPLVAQSAILVSRNAQVSLARTRVVNSELALEVQFADTQLEAADLSIEGGNNGLRVESGSASIGRFLIEDTPDVGAYLIGDGVIRLQDGMVQGAGIGVLARTNKPISWHELRQVETKKNGQNLVFEE